MAQQFNPIQGKLSKMRSSQMLRCHTQADNTPLKTYQMNQMDKENISEYPYLTQETKQSLIKHTQHSLRKITLLEHKSIKKQQSIQFYRSQLNRRKQKYQEQLQKSQEQYERELNILEAQLISLMKQQQEMDEQAEVLVNISHLVSSQSNIQEYSMLEKLSDQVLGIFEQKLAALGIVGTELLYSKETLMESLRYNKANEPNLVHISHVDVQFVSSNKKNMEEDSINFHGYSIPRNDQCSRVDIKENYGKNRNQSAF